MRKLISCVVFLVMIFAYANIAFSAKESKSTEESVEIIVAVIVDNCEKLKNRRVVVVNFTDIDGKETEEGKILAEKIVMKLSQNDEIKVIERKQLKGVLKEQELSMTGVTESSDESIGKILNADAVVSGTIVKTKEYEEVNARMINVKTGEIYCSANPKRRFKKNSKQFAGLNDEQKERIKKEERERKEEKKKDPVFFKLRENHKKDMLKLREKDPKKFQNAIKVLRIVDKVRRKHPKAFLLVIEPKNSKRLKKVQRSRPQEFIKIRKLRKGLKMVIEYSPSYKKMLFIERKRAIDRIKKGGKKPKRWGR